MKRLCFLLSLAFLLMSWAQSKPDATGLPALPPLAAPTAGLSTTGSPQKAENGSTDKGASSKSVTPLALYKAKIFRAVGSRWYAQIDKVRDSIQVGKVHIQYTIHADGTVQAKWLDDRATRGVLDTISMNSLLDAAPFDAFSPALKQQVGEQFTDDFMFEVYENDPVNRSSSITPRPTPSANRPASSTSEFD